MPEFQSKYFGSIVYEEEAVLHFPRGLPGFGGERRFLLIEQAINKPLVFLQSLSRSDLCFVTLPVPVVCRDYQLAVPSEDLRLLELATDRQPVLGAEVACLCILSLEENKPPTVNLLSPVIVNWKNRRAVQAIPADAGYSHAHPLFEKAAAEPCL